MHTCSINYIQIDNIQLNLKENIAKDITLVSHVNIKPLRKPVDIKLQQLQI